MKTKTCVNNGEKKLKPYKIKVFHSTKNYTLNNNLYLCQP